MTLFVVGTPIGNLEDITLRALRVLGEVAVVYAEDTRSAKHLLEHHRITKPIISYFDGNEVGRTEEALARLRAGESIALISEAGMPSVSDPGEHLIAAARQAGMHIEVIPGASAAVTALVGSGLPSDAFHFVGFPPRAEGERQAFFGRLRASTATLILYEAPGRTGQTLGELGQALGIERRACVARELTKIHEEWIPGTLGELADRYRETGPRGEVTIVVAGASEFPSEIDVEFEIRRRVAAGESAKEIAAALSLQTGKPRRQIYQLVLAISGRK